MKRKPFFHFLVLLLFFVSLDTFSQTSMKAVKSDPSVSLKKKLSEKMKSYQLFTLPASTLKTKGETQLSFTIETLTEKWNVELVPNEIRSPNCKIVELSGKTSKEILMPDCPTFAGKVNGNDARFYISDNLMSGTVYLKNDVVSIEPLSWFLGTKEFGDYMILYKSSDVYDTGGTCGVTSTVNKITSNVATANLPPLPAYCKYLNVAIEFDNEFYDKFSSTSNPGGAAAKAMAIMQNVDAIYYNDIGVHINVSWLGGWTTTPSNHNTDPYSNTTNFFALSGEYISYWNANYNGISRDLAHFLTGKDLTDPQGNLGPNGIANQATPCSGIKPYSMTDSGSGTDTDWASCVSHELGHNLTANHDLNGCGVANTRFIMCQGDGKTGTFSNDSKNTIKDFLNSLYCLGIRTPALTVKVDFNNINSTPYTISAGSHTLSVSSNDAYASNNTYSYAPSSSQVSYTPSGSNCYFNTNGVGSFTMQIAYTNSCGTFYRSIPFIVRSTLRVAPNPTSTSTVTVTLSMDDKNDNTLSLPTDIMLYNDKNEMVKSNKPQDAYKSKSLSVHSNNIIFDLKGHPKGLYILNAVYSDGFVEKIKVVLE
jgi:hypothetical protein